MSIEIGRVETLFRYPVKSMGGETPDHIDLLLEGMAGDRSWALRDEALGGITGAKRFPDLMGFSSRLLDPDSSGGEGVAEITFPDGRRLLSSDPAVAESISDVLGEAVTLWPLVPAEQADHYRRGAPVHEDMETELALFSAERRMNPCRTCRSFRLRSLSLLHRQEPTSMLFPST